MTLKHNIYISCECKIQLFKHRYLQVLNSQPKGHEALYSFCADYLDKRLEERENSESDDKVGDGKLSPTKGKQKSGFLRREGTFNLYSTDSGIQNKSVLH